MSTTVLLLIISASTGATYYAPPVIAVDSQAIYFQSMAACEDAKPAIVSQAYEAFNSPTTAIRVTAICYEEAGKAE